MRNLVTTAALAVFLLAQPAFADTSSQGDSKQKPASKAALSSYDAAIQELRELGQVLHHIHQTAEDLEGEVTQPVEMMGEIDVIGGQVIPIMPATAEGFGPTQYYPPRKKYLDLYLSHMQNLIPLLNDEINSLEIPEAVRQTASPMVAQMKTWAADIQQMYGNLKGLTAGPTYANKDIYSQAHTINTTAKGIEKLRHDIYREVKRSEKTAEH